MIISGLNENANTGAGAVGMGNSNMDSYSKNLKKQIEDAQRELQELAGDKEMDPDTKMKRRQEIQKQISDLNIQLRQHQMEERRKAQQEKQQSQQKSLEKNQSKKSEEMPGLSQNSMQAMLSAEGSLKQAKIHGSTANQMENESDIRRTEIKMEGGGSSRTVNDSAAVSRKWDEVEEMEQKIRAAHDSQTSLLAETQDKLEKADAGGSTGAKGEEKNGVETKEGEKPKETKESQEEQKLQETRKTAAPASDSSRESSGGTGSNVDIRL